MSSNKHYGLQLMKKGRAEPSATKHAAFMESDSEESDTALGTVKGKKTLPKGLEKSTLKKQTKLDMQRALEQDSTVYQYDEIYDQMEQKKAETKLSKDRDKKPRYIQKLMDTAERRKRENDRRIERQVQKERQAEGEQFKDKETFVTSNYKKKLEEFAALDEQEKRQDMLEEIGDVTKQQDMSGFYRHLYQTTVDPEGDKRGSKGGEGGGGGKGEQARPKDSRGAKERDRHYRKRKQSESSSDSKKDADSPGVASSSDSSSDDKSDSEAKKKRPEEAKKEETRDKSDKSSTTEVKPVKAEVKPIKKPAPDLSIWEKRTVGAAFDAALKRYLDRKSMRLARPIAVK